MNFFERGFRYFKQSWHLWMFLVLSATLVIFYNVAEDVLDHEKLSAIDPIIGQWLVSNVSSPLEITLAENVSRFGSWNNIEIGILVFGLFLLFKKQWLSAGVLGISLLVGESLNGAIKNFFMRTRPDFLGGASQIGGYSFPSNHSMLAVIFYGMIAYLLTSLTPHRNMRIFIWIVASGIILAVGISRLILGVHYLTDVLGGWLAGGIWLLTSILASEMLKTLWKRSDPISDKNLKEHFGIKG